MRSMFTKHVMKIRSTNDVEKLEQRDEKEMETRVKCSIEQKQ